MIGSGPNGLTAAIVLARAGHSVRVLEAGQTIGGCARTAELTLPGFLHDVCSAIHPLTAGSPFLRTLPLGDHGLKWVHPPAPLAHPLDDGAAIMLERDIEATAQGLGPDERAYRRLIAPIASSWGTLSVDLLSPPGVPKHPWQFARFGMLAARSARGLAGNRFATERARAIFAGLAAHSILPLERLATSAFGLVLAATGHAVGWPFPAGGASMISHALESILRSLGGEIITGHRVNNIDELDKALAILCDVAPRELVRIAGHRLPAGYRRRLERFRHGPGAFKVDWALSSPIPWKAQDCTRAATVHIGGTIAEIAESESAPWRGEHAEKPFVLVAQPTLFDGSRAPEGKHVGWAYCHVPNGSTFDMTSRIEAQIERFAPGFRDTILMRSVMAPTDLERHNSNLVGGDISGGVQDLRQLFARPTLNVYSTPVRGLYLCSSSTPPGGGVHGMCGYHAAHRALRDILR